MFNASYWFQGRCKVLRQNSNISRRVQLLKKEGIYKVMKWTTLICGSGIECSRIQWCELWTIFFRCLQSKCFELHMFSSKKWAAEQPPDAPLGSICQGLQHDVQRCHRFHERCLQIFLPAFWSSRGTTWTCHGYSWDEPHGRWGSLTAMLLCSSLETIETIASLSCQCS